jgi:hypothetical protein
MNYIVTRLEPAVKEVTLDTTRDYDDVKKKISEINASRSKYPLITPIKFSYSDGIYRIYEEVPTTKTVNMASFRSLEDAIKVSKEFPGTQIKEA